MDTFDKILTAFKERINAFFSRGFDAIKTAAEDLNSIRAGFLGKSGEVTRLYAAMRALPDAERPAFGKLINSVRSEIQQQIDAAEAALEEKRLAQKLGGERIDITLPAKGTPRGSLHPLSLVRDELTDYFVSLGFGVADGPEIETDYYNFQALNLPADHPARDSQDTFYIADNLLLRTQTSGAQIRTMERKKPPIKMICPGRTYRVDEPDATHSPVFHQLEGLVVDKGITLCDLKGLLDAFARRLFGDKTQTRLRPSFFPFTEPSVELDVKREGGGWIELLGAGMVNRRVLKTCGIDPEIYTGFAFGIGIDRAAMLKFGITDIRLMYENDVRFLRQFEGR